MKRWMCSSIFLLALCFAGFQTASAATLCVNPHGNVGCFSTITAAVNHASANDLIIVAPGFYKEDVVIGKPLSLVAQFPGTAVVDATGLSNGFYIDGFDHPGLSNVTLSGFFVKNAVNEGILITNASEVTVTGNILTGNDAGLNSGCSGIQSFEVDEAFDCGEGIHLSAVDHSTIAHNQVEGNAGGILVSDDTGPTHDNVITGNSVIGNPFDCGITLASHPSTAYTPGIINNTISDNVSSHNGYQEPGAGAGVGIFSAGPGGVVSGNVVAHNTLTRNGLPGVAFHSHDPLDNLNDNKIIGNQISDNGADTADALTPGPTGINVFGASPITGTLIIGNVITNEQDDIVVKTTGHVEAHLNQLPGGTGLANVNANGSGFGTVDATLNWWGCPAGPGGRRCSSVSGPNVVFVPVLASPF
jgi:nitrous oxidase accessory protein NosD